MKKQPLDYLDELLGQSEKELHDTKARIAYKLDILREAMRNNTLEEVAQHFDAMKSGGDTTASFAIFVRAMKT
jgi:hypothetical protein